jgi:glycerol uptake facilitator-like aquaporin
MGEPDALTGRRALSPVVTLSEAWQKNMPTAEVIPDIAVQIVGASAGVAAVEICAFSAQTYC